MIYLLIFLWMPFLNGLETIEQDSEEGFLSEVHSGETRGIQKLSASPLISLEPKISLSLSEENRQFLFSPARLQAEYLRNLNIIRAHTFPWGIFLTTCMICVLGYFLFKYRIKVFNKTDENIHKRSLRKRTEDRISELKKELALEGNLSSIYDELTKLCREYLEEFYNKKLPVYSENEIEGVVNNLPMPDDQKTILASYLHESFFMKFADRHPTLNQVEKAMQTINAIVKTN